jgi:uncharacterized protein YuzE
LKKEMLLRVITEESADGIQVITLYKTSKSPNTSYPESMKVEYDIKTDILTISLRDAKIRESDEIRPGVIADFAEDGGVVRFEVLDASHVVDRTREMQFALAEG